MQKPGSNVVRWRIRTKQKLIEYKGGKCCKCGYDKIQYPRAFHFHHKDPTVKDFSISGKSWSFERLKVEVEKCDLMCSRCHAELHDELDGIAKVESSALMIVPIAEKTCPKCNKKFRTSYRHQKCCSIDCSKVLARKVERPTYEELKKLISEHSYCAIGRMYGVSDNAIRKWKRHYEETLCQENN